MNTNIFPQESGNQGKSIFKKPDVLFGMAVLAGGLGFVAYKVLPILSTIVWAGFNLIWGLAACGVLLYILTNKKTWLLLHYIHEMTLKKLFGLVIELDPFVIAEDYIQDMIKERENLNRQIVEVDSQKEAIQLKIVEKQKEKDKLLLRAKKAQQSGMEAEVGLAARQSDRIDEYIKQLSPISQSLTKISAYLSKVYTNSQYLIEDSQNELAMKKETYISVTKGNQALNTAMKIFKGDPDKKMLVEQSMEFLKDDIAFKLANMKNAMSLSKDFMKSIDLDTATFEERGLQMLENFNPESLKLNKPEKVAIPVRKAGTVNTKEYDNLLD